MGATAMVGRTAACEAGKRVSCAEKETGDEKVDDIAKKAN
jgi:hypothetical protein